MKTATVGRLAVSGASAEPAATAGRKRNRTSVESAGNVVEESLLSPDRTRIKGKVAASGMVVSIKDGRVLGRHLELKQTFATGYRNSKITNT